jgi:hypothetical protein
VVRHAGYAGAGATLKASSTKGLAALYDGLKQWQERSDFTNLKGLP